MFLKTNSWKPTARRLCLTIKRPNSSKLGLSARQFHWITELVIRRNYFGFCLAIIVHVHVIVSQISQSLVTIVELETLFSFFNSFWTDIRFIGVFGWLRATYSKDLWTYCILRSRFSAVFVCFQCQTFLYFASSKCHTVDICFVHVQTSDIWNNAREFGWRVQLVY